MSATKDQQRWAEAANRTWSAFSEFVGPSGQKGLQMIGLAAVRRARTLRARNRHESKLLQLVMVTVALSVLLGVVYFYRSLGPMAPKYGGVAYTTTMANTQVDGGMVTAAAALELPQWKFQEPADAGIGSQMHTLRTRIDILPLTHGTCQIGPADNGRERLLAQADPTTDEVTDVVSAQPAMFTDRRSLWRFFLLSGSTFYIQSMASAWYLSADTRNTHFGEEARVQEPMDKDEQVIIEGSADRFRIQTLKWGSPPHYITIQAPTVLFTPNNGTWLRIFRQ